MAAESSGRLQLHCCLCSKSTEKRYANSLHGRKSTDFNYIESINDLTGLNIEHVKNCYVCHVCVNKLSSFKIFKCQAVVSLNSLLLSEDERQAEQTESILHSFSKQKRTLPLLGSKPTPKRKRSVASSIILSVEKLKEREKGRTTTVEQLLRSIEKLKAKDTLDSKKTKAKKRLQMDDHGYSKVLTSRTDHLEESMQNSTLGKEILCEKSGLVSLNSQEKLNENDIKRVISILKSGDVKSIVQNIESIPRLQLALQQRTIQRLITERLALFTRDSIHYNKGCTSLTYENIFAKIIIEAKEKSPLLLDILNALFAGSTGQCKGTDQDMATIATVIGMVMHHRDKQASIVQRIYTTVAVRCHADNELMKRFNKTHLMLFEKAKLLQTFVHHSEDRIVHAVSSGQDGKINGDNLDLRVSTNDQRMKSKSSDYHFFASDWTPFRVCGDLPSTGTLGDPAQVSLETFTPTDEEIMKYRENLKVLLARVLISYFDEFAWMKQVVPNHIHHKYSDAMSAKSVPYIMPLLLKNEIKHEDCISIMQSYSAQLSSWYTKAGRGLLILFVGYK